MCDPHWNRVAPRMKSLVWLNYRPGQEDTKDPTPEFMEAARDCIKAVGHAEKKSDDEIAAGLKTFNDWPKKSRARTSQESPEASSA